MKRISNYVSKVRREEVRAAIFVADRAVPVLFPLSPGKGGEGDRTARRLILVSPSPSGKGLGVRGCRIQNESRSALGTGVGGPDDYASSQFAGGGLENSKAARPLPSSVGYTRSGTQTLTPWSPSPKGKGKSEQGFTPSYPPHPLSHGKGGTEPESCLSCLRRLPIFERTLSCSRPGRERLSRKDGFLSASARNR